MPDNIMFLAAFKPNLSMEEYMEMKQDQANDIKEREVYEPQWGMEEEIQNEINIGPSRMG